MILKIKRSSNGGIEGFKARIVAGGNFQTYGEVYMETYASVISFALVSTFLYFPLCWNMAVTELDVKTSLLNGEFAESVSVMSARGKKERKSRWHRLVKATYSLKQGHLAFHIKTSQRPSERGFGGTA